MLYLMDCLSDLVYAPMKGWTLQQLWEDACQHRRLFTDVGGEDVLLQQPTPKIVTSSAPSVSEYDSHQTNLESSYENPLHAGQYVGNVWFQSIFAGGQRCGVERRNKGLDE